MKVKDLIMKLIYCDPEAEVKCITYENEDEDADEFALNIRVLEDYEDDVDLVLDDLNVSRFNEDHVFEILRGKVLDWAKNKDPLHDKNAEKQFMKFIEEVFEFKTEFDLKEARWYLGQDFDDVFNSMKTEMGDVFVTLIILCEQLGIKPAECLELAYKKISKRKGKTINGIFVKEEDLKDVEE